MTTKSKGFTLVEMSIVLSLMTLITVFIFLTVAHAQKIERDTARRDAINRLIQVMLIDNKSTGNWDQCTSLTCPTPSKWTSPSRPALTLSFPASPTTSTSVIWWSSNYSTPAPPAGCNAIYGNLDGYAYIYLESGGIYCQAY